jgi:hypothetical protein
MPWTPVLKGSEADLTGSVPDCVFQVIENKPDAVESDPAVPPERFKLGMPAQRELGRELHFVKRILQRAAERTLTGET